MSTELTAMLSDIVARLERIEALLTARPDETARETLTVEQAMAELGYENRTSFLRAVRVHRIPVTEINSRNFVFDAEEFRAWKKRKTLNI